MVKITNVVVAGHLGCPVDVHCFGEGRVNSHFHSIVWKRQELGATLSIFKSGKFFCAGASSVESAMQAVDDYARLIQKKGYKVDLQSVRVVTMSAAHRLSSRVSYETLVQLLDAEYEPELFNGALLKRQHVNFTVYYTGSVVITGLTSIKDVDDIVQPTLLELELCSA